MNSITPEHINAILSKSKTMMGTAFDKVTVLHVQLPNGFVITESSACVDPANYDMETGKRLCQKKVVDKLWELEGYRLACELEPNQPTEGSK